MRLPLFLLLGTLLLAGCTTADLPDTTNTTDGDNGVQQSFDGVLLSGPTCTADGKPCSTADLTTFSIPKLSLTVQNTGSSTADIALNGPQIGRDILVSKCDEYGVKEFRATVSGSSGERDVAVQQSVSLQPGETLDVTWFVEAVEQFEVVNGSRSCVFWFEVTVDQELETTKQVQVRESPDVPPVSGLSYDTTSETPVELVVEADDTMVQEIIGGEPTPIQARAYIVDRNRGSLEALGHESNDWLSLHIPGVPDRTCSRQEITIQGRSDVATVCRFVPGRVQQSQIFDIVAETAYTYELQPSPVEIVLRPLEAG